jgi:endonuclease YncB( thermonuclease family)
MGSCISYSIHKSTLSQTNQPKPEPEYQYLQNVEYKDTILFHPHITYCKVIKVYDGDTITVATRLPHDDTLYRFSVRLRGIDSPEIHGKTENEKSLALKSRDALSNLIYHKIILLKKVEYEKYGRILADVYLAESNEIVSTTINQWMLDENYAVPYDGGTKHIPKEWI